MDIRWADQANPYADSPVLLWDYLGLGSLLYDDLSGSAGQRDSALTWPSGVTKTSRFVVSWCDVAISDPTGGSARGHVQGKPTMPCLIFVKDSQR
jgi:hypothetical protein